tara:strand:- start:65 stop:427 length:363 start_codon:yes stop_codon:yes gene_type:complete
MNWEDIVKKEPKQGPRISEEMYADSETKKFRDMFAGLSNVANTFRRNEKAIKELIGKEGTDEVLSAIADTLRTYGRHLQNRAGSTDFDTFSGRTKINQDNREYFEETGKEFLDLANSIDK